MSGISTSTVGKLERGRNDNLSHEIKHKCRGKEIREVSEPE